MKKPDSNIPELLPVYVNPSQNKFNSKWKHHYTTFTMTSVKDFRIQLKKGLIHKKNPRSVTIVPGTDLTLHPHNWNNREEGLISPGYYPYIFRRYIWKWKQARRYFYRLSTVIDDYAPYEAFFEDEDDGDEERLQFDIKLVFTHLILNKKVYEINCDIDCPKDNVQGMKVLNLINTELPYLELLTIKIPRHLQGNTVFKQIQEQTCGLPLLRKLYIDYPDFRRWAERVNIHIHLGKISQLTDLRFFFADNMDGPLYFINDKTAARLAKGLASSSTALESLEIHFDPSIPELPGEPLSKLAQEVTKIKGLETLKLGLFNYFREDDIEVFCKTLVPSKNVQNVKFSMSFGQFGFAPRVLKLIIDTLGVSKNLLININDIKEKPKDQILELFDYIKGQKCISELEVNCQGAALDQNILDKLKEVIYSLENLRWLRLGFDKCKGINAKTLKEFRREMSQLKGILVNTYIPKTSY